MTVCNIVTQITAHADERQDYQHLLLTEIVLYMKAIICAPACQVPPTPLQKF